MNELARSINSELVTVEINEPILDAGSNGESEKNLTIGPKLSMIAKAKGLTQSEIAKKCNISRLSVHRFFNGRTELKASDLMSVLRVLDIPVDEEIDQSLESPMLSGALLSKNFSDPVYRDVCVILDSMSHQIRNSLLEQISWWGRSTGCQMSLASTQRIQQYLQKL